jgi:hypothetical protein
MLLFTMATITGVCEWRIGGGGEDRRHSNIPPHCVVLFPAVQIEGGAR